MYLDDLSLLKKLTLIVLIKIVVVYTLWSFFIKDYRVPVTQAKQLEQHLFAPQPLENGINKAATDKHVQTQPSLHSKSDTNPRTP